ncbi:response regulator transcription factor [Saccharibacillus kuerlensis]|uniref:DNA-binding response regulator n=1 Tax=Saccharibacillus kuerlensis TaxID=459527 RepID=A0ABQ2L8S2_9BACL|nr:response regulator [Saccharibacillus kuerlensis]GGO06959.1 DNA-binding response regulator [Saccharibacillus kuerlensis]
MHAKTILVVDDEPRTRQGIKKMLDTWGEGRHYILTAESGREAIEIIRREKVHILLTDIRMPEVTGLMLLQTMKEQNLFPVVIVISAYSEFEYARESLRLGVVNYLLKPISRTKLIEAVEDALRVEKKQERTEMIEKVVDDRLVKANENSREAREPIRDAIQYIDQNIQQEITQKEVADHVHLNPSYFSALFKEQTRMTFSEYVTRRKIQHAKQLLITTNLPIGEVAEESGYKTAKYFIKVFKEFEGITPSTYRKLQNERAF